MISRFFTPTEFCKNMLLRFGAQFLQWMTMPSSTTARCLTWKPWFSDLFPADASLAEKTFRLKVQKLRGGGVRKIPKQKQEEREKRFRSMKGSLVSITTGVGASPSGMDAELLNKCGDAVSKLQAEATHQPLLRLWCPKGARGTRITHDAIWKTSKFIEITCRRWNRRVSRSPRHASASATFWLGCLGGSLPSSFRVRVCVGLLLSSFSRERPSAEQAVGSGKQCLACTWQAATGPALGGWSSGANSSHGGSLRAILWSPTSRWTPLGQHGGLHPLLRLLARCFRRMLSPGRILSSNASVTSVLVNLFCLLVAFLSLQGTKWSLLAWSLATN